MTAVILLLISGSVSADPEFRRVGPLRQVSSRLGSVLADVESRLPAGHPYRAADRGTWAHEGTHGINSRLRNQLQRPGHNCLYVLNGRYVVLREPPVTIRQVAQRVPKDIRGPRFRLYLVTAARDWNNEPLYLFDEWAAYRNGALCRQELGTDTADDYGAAVEMAGYCRVVITTAAASGYHDPELNRFFNWHLEKTYDLQR